MELQLRHGLARFDEQDAALISACSWHSIAASEHRRYAKTTVFGHTLYMHQLVVYGLSAARRRRLHEIDHINGDGLDNRRENLRLATRAQNNANRRSHKGTSRFKGVSWNAKLKAWQAHIAVDYERRALGVYELEQDAARAYDIAARDAFGEFARINFPERINEPPPARFSTKSRARDLGSPSASAIPVDWRQGSRNGNAKLTEEQARAIIEQLRVVPRRSQKSIAEEFGVQQTTVSRIKRGEAWPHLWED